MNNSSILKRISTSALVLILICMSYVVGVQVQAQTLAPGSSLPTIKLETLDGEMRSLSSYAGKPMLINFWASWCSPCVAEMPELEALHTKYGDRLTVVTVAVEDDKRDLRALQKKLGLTLPILFDKDGIVARKFKVDGYPESFSVDAQGKLRFFLDGWRGPTLKIVGPRSWSNEAVIKQLLQ